jgi:hypothetical protein
VTEWDAEVRVDEALARRLIAEQFALCGTLALWGEHEGADAVRREALEGLARTLLD